MFNETLAVLATREEPHCLLKGDPDLYGLGIRVGIYIQTLAVQISALLSMALRQDDYLGEGVIIFILAVGSVLVKQIVEHKIVAVEAAPMIVLLLSQVGVCRSVGKMGVVLGFIYAVEFCGLTALFIWFWWHGMDVLGHSPCPDDKAFFFAKVSLWGWFRTMNKVFAVFSGIAGGVMAIMYFFGYSVLLINVAIWAIRRMLGRTSDPLIANSTNSYHMEDGEWNMDVEKALEITLNIGVIAFVEMTIKWNNITNVHSLREPGQFMPLLIALAQLLAVLYQGLSRFVAIAAADDDTDDGYASSDADCIHDKKTGLQTSVNYQTADPDDMELA